MQNIGSGAAWTPAQAGDWGPGLTSGVGGPGCCCAGTVWGSFGLVVPVMRCPVEAGVTVSFWVMAGLLLAATGR